MISRTVGTAITPRGVTLKDRIRFLYHTFTPFRAEFPQRLDTQRLRVTKKNRGNDGQGVWNVELAPSTQKGGALVLEARRGVSRKSCL